MKQQAWNKDGEVWIDVVTPLEILQEEKAAAMTIEQRVIAIEKFLGVK